jgi:hypothetical protein
MWNFFSGSQGRPYNVVPQRPADQRPPSRSRHPEWQRPNDVLVPSNDVSEQPHISIISGFHADASYPEWKRMQELYKDRVAEISQELTLSLRNAPHMARSETSWRMNKLAADIARGSDGKCYMPWCLQEANGKIIWSLESNVQVAGISNQLTLYCSVDGPCNEITFDTQQRLETVINNARTLALSPDITTQDLQNSLFREIHNLALNTGQRTCGANRINYMFLIPPP